MWYVRDENNHWEGLRKIRNILGYDPNTAYTSVIKLS